MLLQRNLSEFRELMHYNYMFTDSLYFLAMTLFTADTKPQNKVSMRKS